MFTIREARIFSCGEFLRSSNLRKNEYDKNSAMLDTDILISFLLKKERSWILLHSDFDFEEFKSEFFRLVQKRCSGLPVAYITEEKEFYGRKFYVNPSVLIPKPDTETLVERLCKFLEFELDNFEHDKYKNGFFILDMCTGSGCIGISAACEFYSMLNKKFKNDTEKADKFIKTHFSLILADISEDALKVCKKNVQNLLPEKLKPETKIIKADLREKFPLCRNTKYRIITANPPYVPSEITDTLLSDGRCEPELALDGGEGGIDLIEPLAKNAFSSLTSCGKIFTEIGEYNAIAALNIFKNAGFSKVSVFKDLSGRDRVIEAVKKQDF